MVTSLSSHQYKIFCHKKIKDTEILFQFFVRSFKPELICDIGTMDASHTVLLRNISNSADIIAFEANSYNYDSIIDKGIPQPKKKSCIRLSQINLEN